MQGLPRSARSCKCAGLCPCPAKGRVSADTCPLQNPKMVLPELTLVPRAPVTRHQHWVLVLWQHKWVQQIHCRPTLVFKSITVINNTRWMTLLAWKDYRIACSYHYARGISCADTRGPERQFLALGSYTKCRSSSDLGAKRTEEHQKDVGLGWSWQWTHAFIKDLVGLVPNLSFLLFTAGDLHMHICKSRALGVLLQGKLTAAFLNRYVCLTFDCS